MPRSRCPTCATIVTHADGYHPICPTCGFGRETANQAPAAPGPDLLVAQPENGLAIGALVCGIAGFVVGITAPVAVVLGILALRQRVDSAGRAMAIVGLVLGALLCVVGLFVLFFILAIVSSF